MNPKLNYGYATGAVNDDLPWKGVIRLAPNGVLYDEDGDVLDKETIDSFDLSDGKGDGN